MKLYKSGDIEGYDIKDIEKEFNPEQREHFWNWYGGSTGSIIDGKLIVYKHDFDAYLKDEPNLD